MGQIYIHIGLPRTATTCLQKYLFPKSKNKLVFQKTAYSSSGKITNKSDSSGAISMSSLLKKLKSMNTPLEETQRSEFLREVILFLSAQPCGWTKREERSKNLEFAREVAASLLEKAANTSLKDILISTERLAETSSSLVLLPKLTKESEYLIISLSKFITRYTQKNPCIITSLRNPIPYLRSRYCRTTIQRQMINEGSLQKNIFKNKQPSS